MAEGVASNVSCLAVILGASEWPKVDGLEKSTTFRNSASSFAQYLVRPSGLGLPYSHVLDLFDSDRHNAEQLETIADFLRSRLDRVDDSKEIRNLLVYYVGHGAFVGPNRDYILAIRSTRWTDNAASSIRISDLAAILRNAASQLRRFLILDCCFAAAAFTDFQSSGVSEAVSVQTLDGFPPKGTSLLCAASRRSVALSDDRQGRTMFSGALVDVLTNGVPELDEHLSLTEVGDATWRRLQSTFYEDAVRPEVHSPDRREGAVADVPLFPNPAKINRRAEAAAEQRRKAEAEDAAEQRRKAEAEDAAEQRRKAEAEDEAKRQAQTSDFREHMLAPSLTSVLLLVVLMPKLVSTFGSTAAGAILQSINSRFSPDEVLYRPETLDTTAWIITFSVAWPIMVEIVSSYMLFTGTDTVALKSKRVFFSLVWFLTALTVFGGIYFAASFSIYKFSHVAVPFYVELILYAICWLPLTIVTPLVKYDE